MKRFFLPEGPCLELLTWPLTIMLAGMFNLWLFQCLHIGSIFCCIPDIRDNMCMSAKSMTQITYSSILSQRFMKYFRGKLLLMAT